MYYLIQVHDIESPKYGKLQRVQGVAIPVGMPVSITYLTSV